MPFHQGRLRSPLPRGEGQGLSTEASAKVDEGVPNGFMVSMRELEFVLPTHEPLPFLGRATSPRAPHLSMVIAAAKGLAALPFPKESS